tara:strand:- start:4102 stop:4236 length:135 start_codon:yes stop_codon:yes gene_type:complete
MYPPHLLVHIRAVISWSGSTRRGVLLLLVEYQSEILVKFVDREL